MPRPRLWPAVLVLLLATLFILKTWLTDDTIRQVRVMKTIATVVVVSLALLAWLVLFSRLTRRVRLVALALALGLLALAPALVRVRGVTGDLRPIVELRFAQPAPLPEPPRAPEPVALPSAPAATPPPAAAGGAATPVPAALAARAPAAAAQPKPSASSGTAFPQFLGPSRDGTLTGPRLARDWAARPPKPLWRQPLGEALVGLRDRGRRRRHAGAARRGGARRGLRPAPRAARSGRTLTRRATRP